MSNAGGLHKQSFIALNQLCASIKHDLEIRRVETEERIALAKKRNLEWELGLKGSASDLAGYSPKHYKTLPPSKPTKKSSRSRLLRDITVPAVIYKPRRSAAGLRSFHYSIEPIPKSAFFRELASGTKIGPGAGEARVRYTTGIDDEQGYLLGDRVQSDLLGRPLIVSNISKRADQIADFFALVEENERNAKLDKALIVFDRHPEVWRRVVDDPACEPALLHAYRAAQGQGSVEVELFRGADALMKVLKRHGFLAADKTHAPKRREELNGLKLTRGRGGRIQWRIVVALPVEFSGRQRRRAVEAICRRLGERGAMYAAVIHEPVATNHRNNYHAHIDVYDRPCRRLTGDTRDLDNVAPKWRAKIKEELDAGKLRHLKGQWDFAAVREYRSSSGNRTFHKPFRAKKSGAFRAYAFPKQHRAEIARIVNAIAVSGGGARLYDPGTYDAMGIVKEPDEQLGPKLHGLEAKGAPTDAGMRNEERHAEADRQMIESAYKRRLDEIAQQQRAFDLRLKQQQDTSPENEQARDRAHSVLADLKIIAQARYLAELAQLEMHRQLSRARNMIRAAGRAKRLGEDPRGELAALGGEARSYWRAWQIHNRSTIAELRQLSAHVAREGALQSAAEQLQAEALRPVPVAVPTEEVADSVAPTTGQPVPEPALLAVTPARAEVSEAPLLLGRRLKRLIEQAHHGSSPAMPLASRNIMINGGKAKNATWQEGQQSPTEPTPGGAGIIAPGSGATEGNKNQRLHQAPPMKPDTSDPIPVASGRIAPPGRAKPYSQGHPVPKSPLETAAKLQPSAATAHAAGPARTPGGLQSEPAPTSKTALQGEATPRKSAVPRESGEAAPISAQRPTMTPGGKTMPVGPAARPRVADDSSESARAAASARPIVLHEGTNGTEREEVTPHRDEDHAKGVAAYLRKLDDQGVLLRKNKLTGEIVGSPGSGPPLGRTDELLLRWGGMAAEHLVIKQRERRQVQDYLLKHGEALARAGRNPGPRYQRLMKKWEDEPKLRKTLEWFAAEQDEAKRRRAAELARRVASVSLSRDRT